jgi:hypothetical protein
LPDGFQIQANEIEVLARDTRGELLFFFLLARLELFIFRFHVVARATPLVGFGFLFIDEAVGRQDDMLRLVGIHGRHEAELVRPLAPVEHMRIVFRFPPVDQRG